ncbi:SLC13 family permease [Blattabacterium cuenoti]|uniref:SLC13 family permease n=1 Tax=Blattabacterium cuenoti TaxID=1653831 RepID=UPI00163B674E|nr:SLC13 family permease [Blattabacterium cuenoti]
MVIIIFIIGYLFIIFEGYFFLNKIVPSIIMATLCWSYIIFFNIPVFKLENNLLIQKNPQNLLLFQLGKTSEIIFFIIGAMLIISIIERYFAFEALRKLLYTDKKSKFLWKISILSFLLSAVIDNLTATIVLVSLLRKTILNYKERLYYLGIVIIAANAGGVWSPIGDITTTMLWISKKVTTLHLIKNVFIPSVICMLTSTFIISKIHDFDSNVTIPKKNDNLSKKDLEIGIFMLKIGMFLMLLVPIYKIIIGVPPYVGMMFSLGILILIVHTNDMIKKNFLYKKKIIEKIDISSILFFFGVLLSVSSLEAIGVLYRLSNWINSIVPTWKVTSFLFGLMSSIIDNVPLVAATLSMFPHSLNHDLWHFIAYVSGTGGSLLIIGSASGIAAMSIEKINFFWYVKKISWIALIGYISGFIYLLLNPFVPM